MKTGKQIFERMCINKAESLMLMAIAILCFAGNVFAQEQATTESSENTGLTLRQMETRAKRMISNAEELLKSGETERAISSLEAVPRMFPETQARFVASLVLGKHRVSKRQMDKAMIDLRTALNAEDPEVRAETLLWQAKLYMQTGRANEAVMILRRITQDFPTSAFANDAYFEIGQIHFEAGRWARASEAFRMVGTAVPASPSDAKVSVPVLVEAGQRLFVNVIDRDLAVLNQMGEKSYVTIEAASGDKKVVELIPYGRGDEGATLASIETTPEQTKPNEERLTIRGGDELTVTYIDKTTADGRVNVPVVAKAKVVSTGVIAFMDGAYRQRVNGVFANQPAFIRLRDLDLSVNAQPDKAKVTVIARYLPPKPTAEEIAEGAMLVPDDEQIWLERGRLDVILTETGNHTGVFEGRFFPVLEGVTGGDRLFVMPDDKVTVEYLDERHLNGSTPELRTAEVVILVGGSTEAQSIMAASSVPTVQARKLLLEAQLFLQWGSIFKDVGLFNQASAKAQEGLDRIAEIMTLASQHSLDRSVIEYAYAARWDLLLVQDKLGEAIQTCQQLMRRYPDTLLADMAFMKIAAARVASPHQHEIQEGIRVYQTVLAMPNSIFKAEAQFRIAEAQEMLAKMQAEGRDRPPDYTAAIHSYRVCAETFPDSSFAGESFKRIINYYINVRDFSRAIETLERVSQDYPDAPWMDDMLVRWGLVLNRMGNRQGAIEKFRKVVEEYPGGAAAQQASENLKRLGG